jgi:hypothetical protein
MKLKVKHENLISILVSILNIAQTFPIVRYLVLLARTESIFDNREENFVSVHIHIQARVQEVASPIVQ